MPKKRTHEQFIEDMNKINPNIEILSKYVKAKIKVKCRCKLDGCEWEARPDHLLEEHGCPKCAIRNNSGENNSRWNPNLTQEEREIKRIFASNSTADYGANRFLNENRNILEFLRIQAKCRC